MTAHDKQTQKTALITGASSGFGLEFAKLFAADRFNLVLVARSRDILNTVAAELTQQYGVQVKTIVKDLQAPNAAKEVFDEMQASGILIDALVNNAGFASYGFFHEADLQKETDMIQLNITALVQLTRYFLPGMVVRGNGYILNVASTAAFQPGPLMAVYYASKAFVLYFSEAIANEVQDKGVKVTALCPGPTETGFQKRAAMEESKLVKGRKLMDAKTAAKIGYQGLMKGRAVVIPGQTNRIQAVVPRLLPRGLTTRIVRRVQDRVSH